jgi:hypothetical protein
VTDLGEGEGQDRGLAEEIAAVAGHGVPQIVGVAEAAAHVGEIVAGAGGELRGGAVLAGGDQAVGGDLFAVEKIEVSGGEAAGGHALEALAIGEDREDLAPVGEQPRAPGIGAKAGQDPPRVVERERLGDAEDLGGVGGIGESGAGGLDDGAQTGEGQGGSGHRILLG